MDGWYVVIAFVMFVAGGVAAGAVIYPFVRTNRDVVESIFRILKDKEFKAQKRIADQVEELEADFLETAKRYEERGSAQRDEIVKLVKTKEVQAKQLERSKYRHNLASIRFLESKQANEELNMQIIALTVENEEVIQALHDKENENELLKDDYIRANKERDDLKVSLEKSADVIVKLRATR